MKLTDQILNRFFKTHLFKGFLDEVKRNAIPLEAKPDPNSLDFKIKDETWKAQTLAKNEAMRMRLPMQFNSYTNSDRKFDSAVPFWQLRQMAINYPIARACINRRIRQITQLSWDVTTVDEIEETEGYDAQIKMIKDFFKHPMGHHTRMRELITLMIEDVLCVDAVCFELAKLRGGLFDINRGLTPVDPTTIVLKLTEQGATPEPPEIAYAQYIAGRKIAEFTTDDMLYESLATRSYSPYGLAPLESLVLQVESAIRGALYNLNYFKESNVPEGFITLPDEVAGSKEEVEQWQEWFDVLMAGSSQFQRRLKILPGGAEYTAAKKPEDMAFERFELWLLQQTCAVFDVQPQDIGITLHVNKATAGSQQDIGRERGLYPLANFLKEIFDDVIQDLLQAPDLQFFWTDINPADRADEIDIADKEIRIGARSVDEFRVEQGLEPIGLDNFIMTASGPIMVKELIDPKSVYNQTRQATIDNMNSANDPNNPNNKDQQANDKQNQDIKAWRKAVFNDLANGRSLRTKFPSEHIKPAIHKEISEALEGVNSRSQANLIFDQYLDPEVKASMKMLKISSIMRGMEKGMENAETLED